MIEFDPYQEQRLMQLDKKELVRTVIAVRAMSKTNQYEKDAAIKENTSLRTTLEELMVVLEKKLYPDRFAEFWTEETQEVQNDD